MPRQRDTDALVAFTELGSRETFWKFANERAAHRRRVGVEGVLRSHPGDLFGYPSSSFSELLTR